MRYPVYRRATIQFLNFFGVLLTETCFCSQLYGNSTQKTTSKLESFGILASVPAGEMKVLFVVDVVVALTSISETLSVRLVSSH